MDCFSLRLELMKHNVLLHLVKCIQDFRSGKKAKMLIQINEVFRR